MTALTQIICESKSCFVHYIIHDYRSITQKKKSAQYTEASTHPVPSISVQTWAAKRYEIREGKNINLALQTDGCTISFLMKIGNIDKPMTYYLLKRCTNVSAKRSGAKRSWPEQDGESKLRVAITSRVWLSPDNCVWIMQHNCVPYFALIQQAAFVHLEMSWG